MQWNQVDKWSGIFTNKTRLYFIFLHDIVSINTILMTIFTSVIAIATILQIVLFICDKL